MVRGAQLTIGAESKDSLLSLPLGKTGSKTSRKAFLHPFRFGVLSFGFRACK